MNISYYSLYQVWLIKENFIQYLEFFLSDYYLSRVPKGISYVYCQKILPNDWNLDSNIKD